MMSTASAGLLAAACTFSEDLLPVFRGADTCSDTRAIRWCILATGALMLAIALRVHDVLSALTLSYDLLVGGIFVPLMGAIFWRRATPAAAMVAMTSGSLTALGYMVKDGILANTPIYYSLTVSLVSFIVVSLWTRPTQFPAERIER
jgi:solute:Na+ symporter, SSS family